MKKLHYKDKKLIGISSEPTIYKDKKQTTTISFQVIGSDEVKEVDTETAKVAERQLKRKV